MNSQQPSHDRIMNQIAEHNLFVFMIICLLVIITGCATVNKTSNNLRINIDMGIAASQPTLYKSEIILNKETQIETILYPDETAKGAVYEDKDISLRLPAMIELSYTVSPYKDGLMALNYRGKIEYIKNYKMVAPAPPGQKDFTGDVVKSFVIPPTTIYLAIGSKSKIELPGNISFQVLADSNSQSE